MAATNSATDPLHTGSLDELAVVLLRYFWILDIPFGPMRREYSNPPIREAVCEFLFQEDGRWDWAAPGLVYSALRDEFPKRLPGDVPSAPTTPAAESPNLLQPGLQQLEVRLVSQGPLKFWREDDDTGYIAVAPYRLGVHHFRPYPNWERFSDIISKAFEAYLNVLNPTEVQRIGLRYINDIDLDGVTVQLEEYFNFYPFLGRNIPQQLSQFHCLVQMDFENGLDSLKLQIANAQLNNMQGHRIILDLDYFLARPQNFALSGTSDWLEKAHVNLESVFEGCLKDSARLLFEK